MWWFWLSVIVNLVPAAVGLAFVVRHPGRGRWRTWGLLGFGLGLASGLGQMAISASFLNQPDLGGWFEFVIGPGSLVLQLLSLTGAGFVVAAVVADRREVPQPDDAVADVAADEPSASHVVVEDPLAYDPADFEPPRLMS